MQAVAGLGIRRIVETNLVGLLKIAYANSSIKEGFLV